MNKPREKLEIEENRDAEEYQADEKKNGREIYRDNDRGPSHGM